MPNLVLVAQVVRAQRWQKTIDIQDLKKILFFLIFENIFLISQCRQCPETLGLCLYSFRGMIPTIGVSVSDIFSKISKILAEK